MAFIGSIQKNDPTASASSTKTPYQQVFSQPVQQEWKLGDQPTNYGQALATINSMYKTNPTAAQEKLSLLEQYRTQAGNMWYDSYAAPTNNAVNELKSYGINPSDLTADWFNANKEWQGYLSYNGTTTTPSKPGKKASTQEKLAYALYQYQKSMDTTTAAKNEWTAAQTEINYWANRKDLNLSDDDIIKKVFGSNKYSTLKKMDDTRDTGSPLELNEAIDYNSDSIRGAIWAARNGGGTGNSRQDIANYYSRVGNGWTANDTISAKLNKADVSTYSPHEIGMAGKDMDEVGAYFGVPSFSAADVDALRANVDWNDATSVKMYQKVVDAEQTTEKAEQELAELTKAFERKLKVGFRDQAAADKWLDDQLNSGAYNTLAKMDAGLMKGDPVNTTRAVPYRKQMFQQAAYDSIANPLKTGSDIMEEYGMPVSEADKSTVKVEDDKVISAIDVMGKYLTKDETDYFNAVPGVGYSVLATGLNGVKGAIEANAGRYYEGASGEYDKSVLSAIPIASQYEQYKAASARLKASTEDYEKNHQNDALLASEIEPEVHVNLSDGVMADFVYDETENKYSLANPDNYNGDERLEAQHIIDKANERLQTRAAMGEATPETKEKFEKYQKDKEQLKVIDEWLGQNEETYNNAVRTAEEAKAKRDAIGEIAAKAAGMEYDPSFSDSLIDYAGAYYQYQSPPADGTTLIQETAGKSVSDIKKNVEDNNAYIRDLQFVLSTLGDNAPEELKKKMNEAISEAEKENRLYNDYLVTNYIDFDKYAASGREKYEDVYNGGVSQGAAKNWFFMMTPEEQDIYFAIADRKGLDAADQFYADIRDDLIQRRDNEINGVTEQIAQSGWLGRFASEVGAVLTAPINTLAGVAYSAGVAFGADEAEMKAAKQGSHISQSMHNANVTEIKNVWGEKNPDLANALAGLYEIIYNRGNSLMNALTWGKIMPSLSGSGKIANFFNNVISATPIALSAASDALEEAIERGANPTQQAWIFGATLIAESWTEGIEFGHIEKAGKTLLNKQGITDFLKGYIPEALSEVVGESLNDLVENAADYWVKYIDNPEYQTQHDLAVKAELEKDDTLTPEQAEALVHQAEVNGVLHTAVISFFSPGADVIAMGKNTLETNIQYAKEAKAYNESNNGKHAKKKSIRDIRLEHEAGDKSSAEVYKPKHSAEAQAAETTSEATTETTTETAPEAQTEQYPVNGPDQSRTRSYNGAMEAYDSNIILLEEAASANSTAQAAAIASAIDTGNIYSAQAAAAKLNLGMVQAMMIAGRANNINLNTLSMGLQLAAIGNGECSNILNNGVANGLSAVEMASQIAMAVPADLQSVDVIQSMAAGIHEARVNEEFKKLMAKGEADAANEAQQKIDDARENTKQAEENFNNKQDVMKAAQEGVQIAAAAIADDPINDGNQMTAALSKMTSASAELSQAKAELEKAQNDQKKIEDENNKVIETTTAYMRQQAEAAVNEQEAAEKETAAKEEQAQQEANRAQQMIDNFNRLDAEDFIEKFYPNATDEEKQQLIDRFKYLKQQRSVDAIMNRVDYIGKIAKKFNLKAKIVKDITEGGTKPNSNAHINKTTGELVVSDKATLSDIIYAVLPHELMHMAEKSDYYTELANALLKMKYGDTADFDAVLANLDKGIRNSVLSEDILAKKKQYDDAFKGKEGQKTHTNREALEEIVADLMGSLFRSGPNGEVNADLVNRLVSTKPNLAKRIMNSLKSFVKKLAGINDPAVDQVNKAMSMFEQALKDATKQNKQAKPAQKKTTKTDVPNYEISTSAYGNPVVHFDSMPSENVNAALRAVGMVPYQRWGGEWGWRLSKGTKLTTDQIDKAIAAGANSTIEGDPAAFANEIQEAVKHSLGEATPIVTDSNGDALAEELPGGTITVDEVRYSLSSFDDNEQERVKQALYNAKNADGTNRFTKEDVDKYLTDALGIASMIAADRNRLDFVADKNQVFLKKNQDYYYTLDASTLCAKRLLYQGTFNAIQKMMPNEALMPDDLIDLVNIMREMGYETPCGICYVESRRRWLDKYAQEWLDSFKGIEGEPMPTLADLTTSDGLAEMNVEGTDKYAPKTRQAFIDAMNAKGSANPKVVQLRTEYNGDIAKLSKADIQKVKDIGGLRIQSFSDFETPHLLDMIQAVYDMSAVGLTSQAYTKVPNFAWVFGDTGIKINLSLIGKGTGLDADGNLVFDNVEGMNIDQAIALRDRYSKNVGTILVGINDDHIIAAMGDPRIDFIIPFHKSGWSHGELSRIPVLNSYNDYTATQNEQIITGENIVQEKGKGQKAVDNWIAKYGEKYPNYKIIDEGNGKFTIEYRDGYKSESFSKHKERTGESLSNFEPVGANQYWNFDESGEWNARKYLQMCAEAGRLPKFYQFLVDNGDGSFSLPEGNDKRSTAIREGYWKTLIDFKMYENDAYGRTKEDGTRTEVKGSKQTEVTPNVNMKQAIRVMNEHKLGRQMPNRPDGTAGPFIPMASNNALPTAEPAAEAFGEFLKYKRQRQEEMTRKRLATNPKKESDDARNKRIAKEGAEIYNDYTTKNTWGAAANIPLMAQTYESSAEEQPSMQQNRMAIDPETGETVDIRHSLADEEIDMDEVDQAVAEYIGNMTDDELLDYLGLNLPKSWSTPEQVQEFKQEVKSRKQLNAEYDTAVKNGDMAKAAELADQAAKKAGYTIKGLHRTNADFTVFDKAYQSGKNGKSLGNAFYISTGGIGNEYNRADLGKNRMELYVKPGKVFDIQKGGLSKQKAEKVYDKYFAPFVRHDYDDIHKKHVINALQNSYKVIDYIKEAAENGNTTTDEVFKWLGYNSIKDGPQYAIFDPSQIKSADVVTYDDEGNVIPLGKRFKKANDDIRYSLPADAPYLAAVERGEMDEAQRMVDEKANETGYTREVYHGTGNEPFNVFGYGKAGIYTSDSKEVAQTYGKNVMKLYGKQGMNVLTINAGGAWHARIPAELIDFVDLSEYPFYNGKEVLSTNDITNLAFNRGGYDVVVIENVADDFSVFGNQSNVVGTDIVYKDSNQIKSSAPVTYDDNGNIIPLSERFSNSEDIRFSLPSPEILDQQIQMYLSNGSQDQYAAPLEGENPLTTSAAGPAQRQFGSQTAQSSDELDGRTLQWLADNSAYIPDSNSQQLKRAVDWIRANKSDPRSDGLYESVQKITSDDFDYRSADGQARMVAVMAMAAAKGDTFAQISIADAYNRQGTDLGRALQARKLFRLMTPAGRIASLDKMMNDLKKELGAKGHNVDLHFSNYIYEAAAAANGEGEFRRVQKAAAQELAQQLPANWHSRIQSLRMLSMLAHPRTHVRNIIGNMLFVPAVAIKNKIGAVGESLFVKNGEKTKTLAIKVDKETREFAKQDAIKMKDDLTGDSRWNERNMVQREAKPFKGFIQKLMDWNSNALEAEDWFFLKGHYTRALGGWMQANGYTAADMRADASKLERGRAYAIQEAQKATYRDFNKLAATLNSVSRQGGAAGFIVDAVLPFKKTPANILRRGIEYSPIGIAKTVLSDSKHLKEYFDYKNGKLNVLPDKAITPNQFIDHFCSGLTGSAIMAVGALLGSLGIVSVGFDDDDDEFEKLRGGQEYAFKINLFGEDATYTMDWAAPMCMPFFVGAAVFEQLSGGNGGFNVEGLVNDLGAIAEPVFHLSMLDGVNTLFQTSQYDDTNTITQIGGKIVSNYVTSYVPSALGAATRTFFDDTRRKSFVKSGEGGGLVGTARYAIEQTENKLPGLSKTNIAYRNVWGEAETSGFLERLLENFVSPGYYAKTQNDPIIDEMERLYNSEGVSDTQKSALVPSMPNKKVKGTALEAEQYDKVTVERGQTAKKLLGDLMNSTYYRNASDSARAAMVADVWTYATQTANNSVLGTKMDTWVLNSRTNPLQSIVNRSKDSVVSETKESWKAEAVKAVKAEDYLALDTCMERLNELGVSESSVKTAVGNAFKAQYIQAYQRGDYETMNDIEAMLDMSGLGFDKPNKKGLTTYDQWIESMNEQVSDEEF